MLGGKVDWIRKTGRIVGWMAAWGRDDLEPLIATAHLTEAAWAEQREPRQRTWAEQWRLWHDDPLDEGRGS